MTATQYVFVDLMLEHPDGSLEPRKRLSINGVEIGPGVKLRPGVSFGGVDFHKYKGLPILAVDVNGILEIRGFVRNA